VPNACTGKRNGVADIVRLDQITSEMAEVGAKTLSQLWLDPTEEEMRHIARKVFNAMILASPKYRSEDLSLSR
jgi:diphthamide synthase (EF-2-diphthine--ammonia ligase)